MLPDVAMAKTLRQYNHWYMGSSRSAAEEHRDKVLEILSDARVGAPLVQTATYHSQANPKSYFYIFRHRSKYGSYPSVSSEVSTNFKWIHNFRRRNFIHIYFRHLTNVITRCLFYSNLQGIFFYYQSNFYYYYCNLLLQRRRIDSL